VVKLSEKSRKLLRVIYRGLGVAAAALLFQACGESDEYRNMYGPPPVPEYGMPPYYMEDLYVRGIVKSKMTSEPIRGISIWIKDVTYHSAYMTDFDGRFNVYVPKMDNYTIVFTDIDGGENGGLFKQRTINLTMEQCEALAESPLVIEMEN
jgi:putative lipoprotein (rSAM/lipoprotein system)